MSNSQDLSRVVAAMEGSRILAAASEARLLKETGVEVCDLTVGDYSPDLFKAPQPFLEHISREVLAGRNQYPPSDGLPEVQRAVTSLYKHLLGVEPPPKSIVICGGARPPIYAVFRALVNPGDAVVYPVPSWNNDYYTHLVEAEARPIQTTAETNFMPTPQQVRDAVQDPKVRLFCLNSPLNPCGTVISKDSLRAICEVLLEENQRRVALDLRPLFFLFDQVYWPLVYGEATFEHPLRLVPELAPWTLYVDAISKWLVGTGLRLGWVVTPPRLYAPIRDFMGHVGGWAPRPVQAATAALLADHVEVTTFFSTLRADLSNRLTLIRDTFQQWKSEGLPIEFVEPQGAIYLAVQFNILGLMTSSGDVLRTNTDIRRYLLHKGRIAFVPFQAFGVNEDTGWFRISVGAVSEPVLLAGLHRLRGCLLELMPS